VSTTDVAAWVTIVASPFAVTGVFLVWQQLRLMRQDRVQAEARRTAAILPTISVLRLRAEADWGSEIADGQHARPSDQVLDQISATIDSDVALMTPLQAKCADVSLDAVVLASMLEMDLKILRYYLRSVAGATSREEIWSLRWPHMVETAFHYWELLRRLEASLPAHTRMIEQKSPGLYRADVAEEVKAVAKRHTRDLAQGAGVEWPPRHPTIA